MNQDFFIIIFKGLQYYWTEIEMNNDYSIFYKDKFIEKEFKKLCPKSGGVTLEILKSIKFSIIEKGKCYYSQREFAKHFKVSQQLISQSIRLIEKNLNTKFLPFPKYTINNGLHKNCPYRQILIPPSLYKKLTIDGNQELTIGRRELTIDALGVDNRNFRFISKINNLHGSTYIPIYTYLYKYFLYSFLFPSEIKRENIKYIAETKLSAETSPFISFLGENSMKKHSLSINKKHKLTVKKYVVTYDSYGLSAKDFMNYVEIHRVLSKWLDILIDNNIVPKVENTKMFLSSWNNTTNPRFIKHRVDPKSIVFKRICLALTYRMWSEKINIDDIEKAIENFNTLSNKQGRLMHVKKLDCLTSFLWNSTSFGQKDYFKLSLLEENAGLTEYYNKELPPQRAFERVRKMFGIIFYNDRPKLGKEIFKNNYRKFVDFTNEMVNNHRTKETCRFQEYDDTLEGFTDYIKTYFEYVYDTIKKSNSTYQWSPNYILRQHAEFVLWLSHQKGWEDFMKDKKIVHKPIKYELFS